MSDSDLASVTPFVLDTLVRNGAAVEQVGTAQLFAVLPADLRDELSLPQAATLDVSSEPGTDALAFPLEGSGMQWCIDRARSRGRRAAARLPALPAHGSGRLDKARSELILLNATHVSADATQGMVKRMLLEFGYEAQSEERTEGRAFVAVTREGVASFELASCLMAAQHAATAEPIAVSEDALARAAERADAAIAAHVRARLAPFRAACVRRLNAERDRIISYHDKLVRESTRGRRASNASSASADGATAASRKEAISRQRAERLDDLIERHRVEASYWPAGALVLRYEIVRCRFRVRRRRQELDLTVDWDPYLHAFLGPSCAGCHAPTMQVHVCDAAGHITCGTCAAKCAQCKRVTCRACKPNGCGCTPLK